MKSKEISDIFFKHFPLYLLFSVSLATITAITINFKADFTPFNQIAILYFLSFLAIFYSVYHIFKSYLTIDTTTITLILAHIVIIGCTIVIVFFSLLLFSLFLSGEGVGFLALLAALFMGAILVFLILNIIGFIVHKRSSPKGTSIFLGTVGFLIVIGMAMGFYSYANSDRLYRHLVKSKPIQFLYRYNDDIYYVTSGKKGIFRMTPQGENIKIFDADIKITHTADDKFCLVGDTAYFKDREGEQKSNLMTINSNNLLERARYKGRQGWKKMSLIDLKIEEAKDFDCSSSSDYSSNEKKYIFGEDAEQFKNISIRDYQVIGDGYIYYSTEEGLYRMNLRKGLTELLAKGYIGLFNIEGNSIFYGDAHQLNSIVLKR